MLLCCRNVKTCCLIVLRSPGIMSSSETPTIATCGPKAVAMARRSDISSTQGTHQVAQTLTSRTSARREKAPAIFAGSFSSIRLPFAPRALRKKTANGANMRIGAIHFDPNGAIGAILLGALCVIRDQILRPEILLQLGIRFIQVLHVLDEIGNRAALGGQ